MNKVFLIGNITKDIELRQSNSGKFVVEFSIAINNGKDQQGNELPADFINCTAWNKTAEVLSKYATKGTKVCIEGAMKTKTWVDQQGNNRYKTCVLVDRVELLGGRPQQQQQPQQVANRYEPDYNRPEYDQPQYNEPLYQQQSIRPDGRNVTGGLDYSDIKTDDLPFY